MKTLKKETSALAYMEQATKELAESENLNLASEKECAEWVENNMEKITLRARSLTKEAARKYRENRQKVLEVISHEIYYNVRRKDLNQQENESLGQIFRSI